MAHVWPVCIVRLDRWERNEDGAVFAQVSASYEPLQNEEASAFLTR